MIEEIWTAIGPDVIAMAAAFGVVAPVWAKWFKTKYGGKIESTEDAVNHGRMQNMERDLGEVKASIEKLESRMEKGSETFTELRDAHANNAALIQGVEGKVDTLIQLSGK